MIGDEVKKNNIEDNNIEQDKNTDTQNDLINKLIQQNKDLVTTINNHIDSTKEIVNNNNKNNNDLVKSISNTYNKTIKAVIVSIFITLILILLGFLFYSHSDISSKNINNNSNKFNTEQIN